MPSVISGCSWWEDDGGRGSPLMSLVGNLWVIGQTETVTMFYKHIAE